MKILKMICIILYNLGLCMLSVHRVAVAENKTKIIEEVLRRFSSEPRKLLLQ